MSFKLRTLLNHMISCARYEVVCKVLSCASVWCLFAHEMHHLLVLLHRSGFEIFVYKTSYRQKSKLRPFFYVWSFQDVKNRRNPRLVPYILLDERTKKSNKDSLREAVRTLLGYGFNLEAPDQDHGTVQICHFVIM